MSKFTTICRDCVFADYDGITQMDCSLGRINQYRENDIAIIEGCDDPENPPPDGYKEYYGVNTVCNGHRRKFWLNKFEGTPTLEEMRAQVRKEIAIRYNWMLVNKHRDAKTLSKRLAEIKQQAIQPIRVIVIRYQSSPIHVKDLSSLLMSHFDRWLIQDVVQDDFSPDRAIDDIFQKHRTTYYFLSDESHPITREITETVDEIVNGDMHKFAILNIGGVRVVPTSVHMNLQGGMFGTTLQEKVDHICPDNIVNVT